ncbi:MAG: HPr kinase/phosphatase C-terminal domain-containing protein [Pseudomonadota bacterium]
MPVVHASAVAVSNRAALIIGASGSGKSSLALQLIALGAQLVCDDRVTLHRAGDTLIAGPAPNIGGLVEARGVGLLTAPIAAPCPVVMVVDLDTREDQRLPHRRTDHFGIDLPLFHKVENPAWPAALWLYLNGKRQSHE